MQPDFKWIPNGKWIPKVIFLVADLKIKINFSSIYITNFTLYHFEFAYYSTKINSFPIFSTLVSFAIQTSLFVSYRRQDKNKSASFNDFLAIDSIRAYSR